VTDLHAVPTPLEARGLEPNPATDREVDAITRLVANVTGLDPVDVMRTMARRAGDERLDAPVLPVLDVPAYQDVPSAEGPKPAPRRRGVEVTVSPARRYSTEELFEQATRWSITPAGDLRVYDGPSELAAFSGNVWETVRWAEDADATAEAQA